jgi:hypothetical protein
VILHPQFAGTWIWHCHVLSHATGPRDADGNETAAGMIGVIIVDDGRGTYYGIGSNRRQAPLPRKASQWTGRRLSVRITSAPSS